MILSRLLIVAMAVTTACLSRGRAEVPPRPDRTALTQKDLEGKHYLTAYDAVEAMRGNWLHDRGPMTFDRNNQVVVLVYYDDVKLGTVETLRSIPVQSVSLIRHLDGVEAQGRYGIGH